jgi:cell division protein FtsQ
MPRKPADDTQPRLPARTVVAFLLAPLALVIMVFIGFMLFHQMEHFFLSDTRFHLPSAEYGEDPPTLRVEGVKYASKAQIYRVFEQDFGRSVYLFPALERRRNLLAVDWVRDATVSRRWPNRVHVQIVEREPVAFAPAGAANAKPARYQLIDEDGVLLQLPSAVRFNLPVLVGVNEDQPETKRRDAVHRMMQLMREVGPLGEQISEVDVHDLSNLAVMLNVDNQTVNLLLGDQHFRKRLQNFLKNYPGIRKRLPDARTFDVRIEGQITALEGEPSGHQTGE